MKRSVLSNAELTPEYCAQVKARVREFTDFVARSLSSVQREMAAQMLQLFGIEPTDALVRTPFGALVDRLLAASDDFFTHELIYWSFLIATHRTPELFPFFFPLADDIQSLDDGCLLKTVDFLACVVAPATHPQLDSWKELIDERMTPLIRTFFLRFVEEQQICKTSSFSDLVHILKRSPLEKRVEIITVYQVVRYLVSAEHISARLYYPKTTCLVNETENLVAV